MNNTKTFPSLRISERTNNKVEQALKKLNEKQILEITLQDYRRICLEYTSQFILNGGELPKLLQV